MAAVCKAIRRTVEKFEGKYTLLDLKPPTRQRLVRSEANIAAVAASIEEDPEMSIRRRSAELGIARESTRLILRLDLGLHPYKIVLTQELEPDDHRQRNEFANWALEMLAGDPDFGQKIIFSDEAHFWLSGYVNKQNCRYWSERNPQVFDQASMHPQVYGMAASSDLILLHFYPAEQLFQPD